MTSTLKNAAYGVGCLALMIGIGDINTFVIDFTAMSSTVIATFRIMFLILFFYFMMNAGRGDEL